jgi:hypothetical protein
VPRCAGGGEQSSSLVRGAGADSLLLDIGDEELVFLDQVERNTAEFEPDNFLVGLHVALPERLTAPPVAVLALQGEIYDGGLRHLVAAIFPPERDMHHQGEHPERFATLWWAPDKDHPLFRDEALDQITLLDRDLDISGPNLGRMPARPGLVVTAMVNDDDDAFELVLDRVGGL